MLLRLLPGLRKLSVHFFFYYGPCAFIDSGGGNFYFASVKCYFL